MTIDKFVKDCSKIKDQFVWTLEKRDIRGKLDELKFCPLTAMCWHKKKKWYKVSSLVAAGKEIGFTEKNSIKIAEAADNLSDSEVTVTLRNRMMEALGVKNDA